MCTSDSALLGIPGGSGPCGIAWPGGSTWRPLFRATAVLWIQGGQLSGTAFGGLAHRLSPLPAGASSSSGCSSFGGMLAAFLEGSAQGQAGAKC